MSSNFSVDLTYDVIAFKNSASYDYPEQVFEEKIMRFLCDFDSLFSEHIPWLPTPFEFFGGFDYNYSTSEKVANGHYKITLSVSYEPGLSRKAVEDLGFKARGYIKNLNEVFRLFNIDVEFSDNPVVEYVDDGEDYEEE